MKEPVDLLEDYESLPSEVRAITDKFDGDYDYEACARAVEELNALGYHAEYGLDAEIHSLVKIPQFPLSIRAEIVRDFMRMDCYNNKRKYYPNVEGVKYMSGDEKNEVYTSMKEVYYRDSAVRKWFLKENEKPFGFII